MTTEQTQTVQPEYVPQTPEEFHQYMLRNYRYVAAHLKAMGLEQAALSTKHVDPKWFYETYSTKMAEFKKKYSKPTLQQLIEESPDPLPLAEGWDN